VSNGDILKAKKIGGSAAAVYDFADRAIWFAEALFVPLNPKYGGPRVGKSSLGTSYASLPGQKGSIFYENGAYGTAEIVEIECWVPTEFLDQSTNMARKESENDKNSNSVLSAARKFEEFLFGR
jgi:hypothetical protein